MSIVARTKINFSNHELIVTKYPGVLIHDLKLPNREYHHRVTFINTHGIMSVTGDFGNWIFCREFHPSADGEGVSGSYWDEKLEMKSKQTAKEFNTEATQEAIQQFRDDFEDNYGRPLNDSEQDWLDDLDNYSESRFEYEIYAYSQTPSSIDYQDVPYEKIRHPWLNVVYDAFEEICNRMKDEVNHIKNSELDNEL